MSVGGLRCENCAENTFSLGGTGTCTACPYGKYAPSGSTFCSTCQPGMVFNGTYCSACELGKSRSHVQDRCTPCEAGFVADKRGMPYCTRCEKGKYVRSVEDSCEDCPRGSYCLDGQKKFCPAGFYGNRTNMGSETCEGKCHKTQKSSKGALVSECQDTFVSRNDTCTCRPGYGYDKDNEECIKCPVGEIKPAFGVTECVPCASAFKTSNKDRTLCSELNQGPLVAILLAIACTITLIIRKYYKYRKNLMR